MPVQNNIASNFLGGFETGQKLYANYQQGKARRAVGQVFERLKTFDAPADEPDAPAAALPVVDGVPAEGITATIPADQPVQAAIPQAQPAKKSPVRRTLGAKDFEELDTLIANAAAVSGDPQTYSALKNVATSQLQARVLKEFGAAHVAMQNGDTDGVEKALRRAYYYVPDDQELKIKKDATGQLIFKNPLTDKEEPLTSESLDYFRQAAMDPAQFGSVIWQRKQDTAKANREERGVAVQEGRLGEEIRSNKMTEDDRKIQRQQTERELGIKQGDLKLKIEGQKYDNLLKVAQAANQYADAEYRRAQAAAEGSGIPGGMKANDARQYGEEVNSQVENFLIPRSKDSDGVVVFGARPKGYEMFYDAQVDEKGRPTGQVALNAAGQMASMYGQAIGIANPQLGPGVGARTGIEIARAMMDEKKTKLNVYPNSGQVEVMVDGRPIRVKVPPQVLSALTGAAQEQAAPAAGAVPAR